MSKQNKLDRVPPYLPIIWQDWEGSLDTQSMTLVEEGFFFRLLRKLWVLDEVPADPWKLSKLLHTDYRTTAHWLEKYSHLTVRMQRPCSDHAVDVREGCAKCAVTLHNEKLRNLKIDVNSGLDLGTTEPNLTQPNLNRTDTVPAPEEALKPQSKEEKRKAIQEPDDTSDPSPLVREFSKGLGRKIGGNDNDEARRMFEKLLVGKTVEEVLAVMRYAFASPAWNTGIKGIRKISAWLYFTEKYDQIKEGIALDAERDQLIAKKMSKPTVLKGGDGKPLPEYRQKSRIEPFKSDV